MSTFEQATGAGQPAASTAELAPGGINARESLRIALHALLANKLRTALTALGVIIGVGAVIALLAIGRGAQQEIAESITANGANLLTVRAGSLRAGGFSSAGGASQSLTMDDAEALADPANVPDAALVSPETMGFGRIVAGAQNTSAMVSGATSSYLAIHNHTLQAGGFIEERHVSSKASVAVLGSRIAETLFGQQDPIGRSIRINGQAFRVLGVLAARGGTAMGSVDDVIIVPITAAQYRLFGGRNLATGKPSVSAIVVQASDQTRIEAAWTQIAATLRERHRLPMSGQADDFSIDNQQDLIETLSASRRTMTLYLGAIAAISLIVGGIGIMNIMLVSIHERTREIGLRKALGARERDILTQFLFEALALSGGGGLLGVLIGVLIALAVNQSADTRASVSPESLLLALGVALAIGLFFGIEPARRAARLDPIDALRYE